MYPNSPSEWWSSQIRHSSYDMPRVASTFGSTQSGRSIFAIRPSFLCPVAFRGRRVLSHGFGYAATDAMVHYEAPAMSRQYEHGRSSIMLGVRIAKGTITAPPITWFGLDLAERLSGRPRLRASLIVVIQFGPPERLGP